MIVNDNSRFVPSSVLLLEIIITGEVTSLRVVNDSLFRCFEKSTKRWLKCDIIVSLYVVFRDSLFFFLWLYFSFFGMILILMLFFLFRNFPFFSLFFSVFSLPFFSISEPTLNCLNYKTFAWKLKVQKRIFIRSSARGHNHSRICNYFNNKILLRIIRIIIRIPILRWVLWRKWNGKISRKRKKSVPSRNTSSRWVWKTRCGRIQ